VNYITNLFEGRLGRKPYIMGTIVISILFAVVYYLFAILTQSSIGSIIFFLCAIVGAVISYGMTTRRLHDMNRSGWYTLLLFIPYLDFIFWILFMALKGTSGKNKYGEASKKEVSFSKAILNQ
jgi:uncharacterized membrane protein YhaH (DUF805 family)